MAQQAMNRHKYWLCPFFKWDGPEEISCEGGRPRFPDKYAANAYMNDYCSGSWKECTLAIALLKYYEEET